MKAHGIGLSLLGVTAAFAAATLSMAAEAGAPAGALADAGNGFKIVDLRSVVNMGWQDEKAGDGKGGWTDQGDTDMRNVTPGVQKLLGIPFDLIDAAKNDGKAVLTLKSRKFRFGPAAASVDVGAKAAGIYFLHASAWTGGHMATYVVEYADGSTVKIPIRAGDEVNDWWDPKSGTQCRAALHVPNEKHDNLGLLAFGWTNPSPDKPIKSLRFQTENADGIVVLAAVTLSDKPAALPDDKDIPLPDYLQGDRDTLDKTQWFPVEIKTDPFAPTCIDQAAQLGGPAGAHGFLKTVNGKWVFEDGTPARLVGVMGNPPRTRQEAVYMARFMAKYGFTMVRVGHLVTEPSNDSIIDWKQADTQHFNTNYLDRLDFFINELAKNGIYTRISTIWYRKMKKGDNVEGFDEAVAWARKREKANAPRGANGEDLLNTCGLTFFHPRVIELNIALEKALMAHRNPYRGNRTYGEDPAICQYEVTNEDGVFFATFDGLPPVYRKMVDAMWIEWLRKKYGSNAKLAQVWGDDLAGTESLDDGTIGRYNVTTFGNKVPDKPHRLRDQVEFYAQLENGYFQQTKDALRAAGVKQPMCGSGWFGGGSTFFADIWANAKGMDYIDRHHYWAGGPGGWQILSGLTFNTDCALKKPELILKLGGERVIGMPYTISEWANVLPNQFRLEAPPLMGFYGYELGGWDVPIHFAWGGEPGFCDHLHWMWPVNEASTLCQYPAVSEMIRRADIREGPDAFIRNLSDDTVLSGQPLKDVLVRLDISGPFEAMSSAEGVNARSLAATYAAAVGRTGIAFTGKEQKPDASMDLNKYIDLDKKQIRSATGELYWDYGDGYVTANAPRMQAAVGFFAGKPMTLKDCEIRTSNLIASVMVTPVDDQPLGVSRHILITAVGRCRNPDMEYSRGGQRLITRGEKGPTMLEGVKGSVTLNRAGPCTVTALDPYGYKTVDVAPRVAGGRVEIPLDGVNKAAYYEVTFR